MTNRNTLTHYDSTSGAMLVSLSRADMRACSAAGAVDDAVADAITRATFHADRATMIKSLRETGAWDADDLNSADDDTIKARVLWIAACDLRDQARADLDDSDNDDAAEIADALIAVAHVNHYRVTIADLDAIDDDAIDVAEQILINRSNAADNDDDDIERALDLIETIKRARLHARSRQQQTTQASTLRDVHALDSHVLLDVARMLDTAARRLRTIANDASDDATRAAKALSEARALLHAAQARID